MKGLFRSTAAALFIAAATVCATAATNVCPAGSITADTRVSLNTSETQYNFASGVGCNVGEDLNVLIDGSVAYGTPASPMTTVAVGPSVIFGRRACLAIRGGDYSLANGRSPYTINVRNNAFYDDAMLTIAGALPANSVISIYGNRFNASSSLGARSPSFFTERTAASIAMDTIYLLAKSSILISMNSIYGSDIYGASVIHGVYTSQIFGYGDGASLAIVDNNITAICNPIQLQKACAFGVSSGTLYAYANTVINVDRNRMYTAGGLIARLPLIVNPVKKIEMTFDANYGSANTMYVYLTVPNVNMQPFIIFDSINIQNSSRLSCSNNTFQVNGANGMIGFNGGFDTFEGTQVDIMANVITTQTCDPGIYFVDHVVDGKSRLTIASNVFYRDDDTAIEHSMVYFVSTFGIKSFGFIEVSGNEYGGREPVTSPSAILVDLSPTAASSGFTFNGDGSLYVCSNRLHGVDETTADLVRKDINAALHYRVKTDGCRFAAPTSASNTTTTVPTTTTATTEAPTTTTSVLPPIEVTNSTAENTTELPSQPSEPSMTASPPVTADFRRNSAPTSFQTSVASLVAAFVTLFIAASF